MNANPLPQLWTDERIDEWPREHWYGVGSAEAIAREIRDDYEAALATAAERIANLEAKLRVAETGLARLMADAERDGELLDMYEGVTDGDSD